MDTSGKLESMPENFKKMFDKDDFERAEHTNSVFFLGCLFYKELSLEKSINIKKLDNSNNFLFIWFLTALAHDFGYEYEKNFKKFKNKITSIDTLKKHFEIDEDITSADIEPSSKAGRLYTQIKPYFEYRYKDCKIDHGILAGIMLFDSLEKHRKDKEKKKDDDFYWGEDLRLDYAHASIAIATHNIWNVKDESLNFDRIFPISFNDYPLLFLLGLVDTLEPIKTFYCMDTNEVLKNIYIEFSSDEKKVTLSKKDDSSLDFEKIKKKLEGLENWLDVEVCLRQNQISIKINQEGFI